MEIQNIEDKLAIILTRTAAILRLLERKKEPADVRHLPLKEGLVEERQAELMKIFQRLCGLDRYQKEKQSFPKEIRQPSGKLQSDGTIEETPNPEVVPYSVLKNRCTLRKAFKPREGEHDSGSVFDAVVEASGLVVKTLDETNLKQFSETRCVWSPKEFKKLTGARGFAPQKLDAPVWDVPATGLVFADEVKPKGLKFADEPARKDPPRRPMFSEEDLAREDEKCRLVKESASAEESGEDQISIFKKP